MEFSAQKSDLLRELDLVQGVVEKKATIPILSNVLLETADSTLRISATDLELGIRCLVFRSAALPVERMTRASVASLASVPSAILPLGKRNST